MTKDPLLVDLGVPEEPFCYNQGYGLRFTCPEDGGAPILKIVKYLTRALPPGYLPPSSIEPDLAIVLASYTLTANELILDSSYAGTGNLPYQGLVQELRLRVRRTDQSVILEAFMNGAALLLGLRTLGSPARYRTARQIVGHSTAPFVLALFVVWPLRIAVFGGDLFRSGGSDEGAAGHVLNAVDAAFALWGLVLAVVGVRVVERWSLARALGATAFAAVLFGLLLAAALFA